MATLPAPLYLVEITVYDPGLGTTKVLRYASGQGFTTKPSESPASTCYDARIKQPVDISRTMFSGNSTIGRSTVGIGDLILSNDDGALDALVDYGFDGQSVVVRRTTTMNPSYPSDFTSYTLTATGAEFTSSEVRLQLRDRQQLLDVPLQTTKYAGSGSLEGGSDLKGKPKPVGYGVQKNVPAPCVDPSKLIYQVNDGAISSVDTVYDRGIPLLSGVGSWTSRTGTFSTTTFRDICYGNGLFVAVAQQGKIATSPDGATWTSRTSGLSGTTIIYGVAYGNSLYVAVADTGQIITSPDGVTWTTRTSGVATDLVGITYGNSLFVAVGLSGVILTSPDGVTWTSRTSGTAESLASVAYGNGIFVVVASSAAKTLTSSDGTTWTVNTLIGTSAYGYIAFTGSKFVAVDASTVIATTTDGKTFSEQRTFIPTPGKAVRGVTVGNGTLVYVGDSGAIGSSGDAVTWALRPSGTTSNLQRCAFGGNTFVAVGSGVILSSASVASYASQADLLDDSLAPAPGTFKYYAAGGYFRLGSKPDGIVTADVTQGATSADRTHAQIFKNLFLRQPSLSSSDISSADITALDSAQSAVAGIWFGPDAADATIADGLDAVAQSCGAWWAADVSGVLRVKQLTAPSGTAVLSMGTNTGVPLKKPLERLTPSDATKGIPTYKVTHRWGRYYQTITTDLAAGVDDASRAQFAQEWRDATDSDSSVLTAHPLSVPLVIESLFSASSDASTEATRVLTLRKARRGMYEALVELNDDTKTLDIGNVVSLTYSRFGLSGGVLFRVLDLRPNASRKELTMTLWGGS